MICVAFFFQILPNLHFILASFTYSHVVVTYSHVVTYSQIHSQHAICEVNCVLLRNKRRVGIIACIRIFDVISELIVFY